MSANALSPLSSPGSVAVRSRVWVILIGLLAAMAFVASAPAASAHAKLVSITPADGATVTTPPDQVVITFSEDLLATAVRVEVKDAAGRAVTDGAPVVKGPVATQPLVGGLATGSYTVSFRVVSKDGHPVSGSTTFRAQAAAATTAPSSPGSESPTASTTVPVSTTPVGTGQSSDVRADPAVTESGFPWGWAVAALLATVALAAVGLALRRRPQGEGRHLD